MEKKETCKICIRQLKARCIVGINDWERLKKQEVVIDITLLADLAKACQSDDIADTLDYKKLKNRIIASVEESKFRLIERLAYTITDLCLEEPLVEKVTVAVDKPGALRFARSVGVEITRARGQDAKRYS